MSNKQMTVTLNGKDLVLTLDVTAFYEEFEEITGKSIQDFAGVSKVTEVSSFVKAVIYAGHVATCEIEEVKPEYSSEQINAMTRKCGLDYINEIISRYIK